jgi:hypothetical protein
MASSGKRKTTMAKLSREAKLRERRVDKDAKKHRRKQARLDGHGPEFGVEPELGLDPEVGVQPEVGAETASAVDPESEPEHEVAP